MLCLNCGIERLQDDPILKRRAETLSPEERIYEKALVVDLGRMRRTWNKLYAKTVENAGKGCGMKRNTAAKPRKELTAKDFAKIVKLFKKYVSIFAKRYPQVALVGLRVDPTVHDTLRHFAVTGFMAGERVPTVRIAPELAFEPVTVQLGIIIHEIAHSVRMLKYLPSPKGYDANERATDKLAEEITGLKIYYDSRGVEVAGRGAKGKRPRPAGLR
jgi:hypothetical protein